MACNSISSSVKQLFSPLLYRDHRPSPLHRTRSLNRTRIVPLGETTSIGIRTLLHQEGKVLDEEAGKNELSSEHIVQIKAVCAGAWINKFTTSGKGPLHPRFVWVDPATMTIHWAKTMEARYINSKETKKDILVGVRLSASGAILKRKDFNPVKSHKFAFTIFTKNKVLDVVALSSDDFKMWLNGLQLLLHLGNERAFKVINGRKGSYRET